MQDTYPGVEHLIGGAKGNFIEDHLAEIKAYYSMHGREATKRYYHLSEWTMTYRILDREVTERNKYRYYDSADIVAQMAHEDAREAIAKVKELEGQYNLFVDTVSKSLLDAFFKPLLQSVITLPVELELTQEERNSVKRFVEMMRQRAKKIEEGG